MERVPRSKTARPTLEQLLHFKCKTRTFNVAAQVGTAYARMGVFLLNDETGVVLQALEIEHMKDAEKINYAIFSRWLQGNGAQPVAWSTLIGVLRKIGLLVLADDIEGGLSALEHSTSDPTFTFKNVVNALKDVVEWKLLGDELNISAPKIKEIDADNRGQVAHCRRALVHFWLESDVSSSWEKLINALKSIGKSVLAEEIRIKYYPMYQVSSPPLGVNILNITSKSMTISWQSPRDPNGLIRGYQVSYTPHGESECLHDIVGDTTITVLNSLKPHTEYTIRVRAKTVDFGDYSTTITVSTLKDDVTYKYDSGLEDTNTSEVAFDYDDQSQEAVSGSDVTYKYDSGLEDTNTSEVAFDCDDPSQEAVSGSAPIDVMAQLINNKSISAKVTWKIPNDMQTVAKSYKVFYSSSPEQEHQSEEVKELECVLENLQPNTTYEITVGLCSHLGPTHKSCSIKITTKQYFRYQDLQLDPKQKIGKGAYGAVYRSRLSGNDVAIKTSQYCESELKVLSMIHHENIVDFLGCAEDGIHCAYVMELADSSLYDFVHTKNNALDWTKVTKWATHIAKGLYYLHYEAMKPKHLIHCDMKPRNVLLFKGVCKICDFGSIKHIDITKTTDVCGTTIYRPPEYFIKPEYRKKAYRASDVFSYGLTLWEMLKREVPHANKTEAAIENSYRNRKIPKVEDQWPFHLKDLYASCCSLEMKERPTFQKVLEKLSSTDSTSVSMAT